MNGEHKRNQADSDTQQDSGKTFSASMSMHANVPVWYDCCSCEAEPYWQQAMAEEPNEQDAVADED